MNGHQHDTKPNGALLPGLGGPMQPVELSPPLSFMEREIERLYAEMRGYRVFLSILADRQGGALTFTDAELENIGERVTELVMERSETDSSFIIRTKKE